ncbi:unnamed protein product, partial [Prorocentrum cordatum]
MAAREDAGLERNEWDVDICADCVGWVRTHAPTMSVSELAGELANNKELGKDIADINDKKDIFAGGDLTVTGDMSVQVEVHDDYGLLRYQDFVDLRGKTPKQAGALPVNAPTADNISQSTTFYPNPLNAKKRMKVISKFGVEVSEMRIASPSSLVAAEHAAVDAGLTRSGSFAVAEAGSAEKGASKDDDESFVQESDGDVDQPDGDDDPERAGGAHSMATPVKGVTPMTGARSPPSAVVSEGCRVQAEGPTPWNQYFVGECPAKGTAEFWIWKTPLKCVLVGLREKHPVSQMNILLPKLDAHSARKLRLHKDAIQQCQEIVDGSAQAMPYNEFADKVKTLVPSVGEWPQEHHRVLLECTLSHRMAEFARAGKEVHAEKALEVVKLFTVGEGKEGSFNSLKPMLVQSSLSESERADFFVNEVFGRKVAIKAMKIPEGGNVGEKACYALRVATRALQVLLHLIRPSLVDGVSLEVFDDAGAILEASAKTDAASSVWQTVGLACVTSPRWNTGLTELAGQVGAMKEVGPIIQVTIDSLSSIVEPTAASAKKIGDVVEGTPHFHAKCVKDLAEKLEFKVNEKACELISAAAKAAARLGDSGNSSDPSSLGIKDLNAFITLARKITQNCVETEASIIASNALKLTKESLETSLRAKSLKEALQQFNFEDAQSVANVLGAFDGVVAAALQDEVRVRVKEIVDSVIDSPRAADATNTVNLTQVVSLVSAMMPFVPVEHRLAYQNINSALKLCKGVSAGLAALEGVETTVTCYADKDVQRLLNELQREHLRLKSGTIKLDKAPKVLEACELMSQKAAEKSAKVESDIKATTADQIESIMKKVAFAMENDSFIKMTSAMMDVESVADVKKQTPKEFFEVDADSIVTAAVMMKKR